MNFSLSFSLLLVIFLSGLFTVSAQDDLLEALQEDQEPQEQIVSATFKGTRLINGHSIETRKAGVLDFIISHRFGTIDGGAYELFGLDNATVRFGLEYAVSDRLFVGLGRSSFEKTYDGFLKYRLLRQTKGQKAVPLSVTLFGSSAYRSFRDPNFDLSFTDNLATTIQVLIARKLYSDISLQLMPTWVHHNTIKPGATNNEVLALGTGGRVKISPRIALCLEYYYQFQKMVETNRNAFAIGFDIETGGHVFQLHFTNAISMVPKGFISETRNNFFQGEINFGFNISRTFQVKK
jgi:hypothetical protein